MSSFKSSAPMKSPGASGNPAPAYRPPAYLRARAEVSARVREKLEQSGILRRELPLHQTFRVPFVQEAVIDETIDEFIDLDDWTMMDAPAHPDPDDIGLSTNSSRDRFFEEETDTAPSTSQKSPVVGQVPRALRGSELPLPVEETMRLSEEDRVEASIRQTSSGLALSLASAEEVDEPVLSAARLGPQGTVHSGSFDALPALDTYPFLPIIPMAKNAHDERRTDLLFRRTIGEGGAGRVSLATQRSLFREVALKTVKPDSRVPHPEQMLLHEGIITGHLEHPNIIPVHALGYNEDGQPMLVMKYVEGVAWSVLLKDDSHPFWGKLKFWSKEPLVRHLEVLIEICKAVQFAHSRGIIHRDIKPSNVMLGEFGEVYLLDWGLALSIAPKGLLHSALEATQHEKNNDGFYGTPMYMAPEMLDEDVPLGRYTDIYLLGATLYEILHGHPPHLGKTMEDILRSVFLEYPIAYSDAAPTELVRVCKKAMEPDFRERYQDVEPFRAALIAFLQHRASIECCEEASAQLEQLRVQLSADTGTNATHSRQLYRAFHDCRFGFLQALREWEGNAEARRGLDACLTLMISHEIQRGHLDAAESLLEEFDGSVELSQQLAVHRGRLAEARREQGRLQQLRRDQDFSVARTQQLRLMLTMGAMATVFAIVRFALGSAPDLVSGYKRALMFAGLTTFVLSVGLFLGRHSLFQNEVNRRFIMLMLLCCGTVTFHRALRAFWREPLEQTFLWDLILVGCIVATGAITLRPWLAWVAAVLWAGAAICKLSPAYTHHVMTLCLAAGWLLCGFFWGRERKTQMPEVTSVTTGAG